MWRTAPPRGKRGYGPFRAEGGTAAELRQPLVAVAVDRDKPSQSALKWALDNIVPRGQTVMLVHVASKFPSPTVSSPPPSLSEDCGDLRAKDIFLPFRCFCAKKDVRCKDVLLDDDDVAKAITEFLARSAVEKLVIGLPSRNSFVRRFNPTERDIPTAICRGAPDFCTVYVVGRGKVTSLRKAVRPAPIMCPLHPLDNLLDTKGHFKPSFPRGPRGLLAKASGDRRSPETRMSFGSPGRLSVDRSPPSPLYDRHLDIDPSSSRLSIASDGFDLLLRTPHRRTRDESFDFSALSQESARSSWSSQEEVEMEMRRLRQELKQTIDMYSTARQEALSAKQMARELRLWKKEEEQRLENARAAEAAALTMVEKEKAKSKAAAEAAETARKMAEMEARRRRHAEMAASKEAEERTKALVSLAESDTRYRRYSIEEIEAATDLFAENRKIGEGGYGPVFRGSLDHTPVAIKILRPNAAQGRSQFQREIEVLSCIRHPNMVLLLGACPEYGCLVYEYMEQGSLEDRLFQREGIPALPWELRFKIAAEIGTGLLFLHQTRPEPVVHRDLKPGNILLDGNFVSKIADVGLARLLPATDNVTQCRITSTAGTFCYIDPEYQKTGMLGTKSDIYSFGVILLQLITGQPPIGLAHRVERAIEEGAFEGMLDPAVHDWPLKEALSLAKMAVKCAELRRKDRPDLSTVLLPELNRLRAMAEESLHRGVLGRADLADDDTQTCISNETMSDHQVQSSCESSKSKSSGP